MRKTIPELKINLIMTEVNYSSEDYMNMQRIVDECIDKYSRIYPNFFITYLNIYKSKDSSYIIDECSIDFTYLKEMILLSESEKIFISKEKIKMIMLKECFEELKLCPIEEHMSNVSIVGETYREAKKHFQELNII